MGVPISALPVLLLLAVDPPPRQADSMMAYDGRHALLFGGAGQTASLGDFWSWDGARWSALESTPGPPPRNSGALAFDSRRGRAVLFGGRGEQGALSDTWEWDGRRWQLLDSAGGPPPIHSVAAFDPRSSEVVLFGPRFGQNSQPKPLPSETWTWKGRRWQRAPVTGAPTDCIPIGMAGPLLFVAKMDPDGAPRAAGEVWEWTSRDWRRSTVPPPPSTTLAMPSTQLAGTSDHIVLFDGATRTTWTWRGARWTSVVGEGPTQRSGHQMAFDRRRARVVLFGGSTVDNGRRIRLADTWVWDGNAWTRRL
jgi:hypothetical protein